MNAKLPAGTLDKLWSEPGNWRAGIIYICKDDPRVIVPKRSKWGGWTLNFTHPAAWLVLLVSILSILVPVALLSLTRTATAGVCLGFSAAVVVFWSVLSRVLSSAKRYENG